VAKKIGSVPPTTTAPTKPVATKNPVATTAKKVEKVVTPTAKPLTPTASIHRGRTTGMPVMKFQDNQLAQQPTRKLTDQQLLDEMKAEFPNSKGAIFMGEPKTRLAIMKLVRRLFNESRHGHQTIQPPAGGVSRYDEKGNIVPETVGRTRSAKPEPVAATPPVAVAAKPAMKVRKVA
jgi:hypothetical protein